MKLDFSKCKTPEDVEKVFKKKMPEIKKIKKKIRKLEQER